MDVNEPFIGLSAALREKVERGEEPFLRDPEKLEREYKPAADLLEVIDRILSHVRFKDPSGSKFIPLIGHRDYGVAGAEGPQAFDHALGEAQSEGYLKRKALDEAAYRITPEGLRHLRSQAAIDAKVVAKIFLSHAAVDKHLAMFVHDELLRSKPSLRVFVASRAGDIRADQDWLPVIQRELRAADAYCVLLTPNSNGRPWVWFETGAAWMSGKKWVIARVGLAQSDVPLPLSIRQTYGLNDPDGAREVFRALDLELTSAAAFAESVQKLGGEAIQAGLAEDGWEGLTHANTYYAWNGPLSRLRDYEPEAEPPGLLDALKAVGMTPRWSRRDRRFGETRRQVFATDRATFRRAINWGEQVLTVSRDESGS